MYGQTWRINERGYRKITLVDEGILNEIKSIYPVSCGWDVGSSYSVYIFETLTFCTVGIELFSYKVMQSLMTFHSDEVTSRIKCLKP